MAHLGEGRRRSVAKGTATVGVRGLPAWVRSKRHRIFASGAAAVLLIAIVLLLLPDSVATIGLAFLLALLAGGLALVSLVTWWAERRGITDSSNLWDDDTADDDETEQLFDGFSGLGGGPGPDPRPRDGDSSGSSRVAGL